jgi:hypothetical protein
METMTNYKRSVTPQEILKRARQRPELWRKKSKKDARIEAREIFKRSNLNLNWKNRKAGRYHLTIQFPEYDITTSEQASKQTDT